MVENQGDTQVLVKFNADARKKYIEGLKKTYLGVLLSTELNAKTSKVKDVKTQIENLIDNNNEDEIEGDITIGETKVNVTLKKQNNNTYSVKFAEDSSQIDIKETRDYTTEDLLTLCAQHELTISKDEKGNNVFSVTIKGEKNTTVGGPGKISIFTQHLSYIKETIEHLEKGGNPTKEFALATGTGKTYIELILEYIPARLMGTRYVSLAPNEMLIIQKLSDWKKYLSNYDINDIELNKISDEKGCSILTSKSLMDDWSQFLELIGLAQLPGIIKALNIGDTNFEIKNGKIKIDGKDFVILADKIKFDDKEYKIENGRVTINHQSFELDITKPISLSFDEEHTIAWEELCKIRMLIVSIFCPTLFLTATPSIKTYNYVKEIDGLLKTLSLMEKMKSEAYGSLDLKVYTELRSKNLAKEYANGVEEYVMFEEAKDKHSYANLTGEELKKKIENYLHTIKSAIGELPLVLAESEEQINNLTNILEYGRDQIVSEYSRKSTGLVGYVANLMESNKAPDYKLTSESKKFALITQHIAEKFDIEDTEASEIVKECYDFSNIADYSVSNVMHKVIENTLSCLTGLSQIELDKERFSDIEGLVTEVKKALESKKYNLNEYVTEQGNPSNELKDEIVQQMQSVINVLEKKKDTDLFTRLVKNWSQDKKLNSLMPSKELRNIPKKLVKILSSDDDYGLAMARDYLEYHGVAEAKINKFCNLGKKVSSDREEFNNLIEGLGDQARHNYQNITPLGDNEKDLLEELGKELGMILQNRDKLTYGIFSSSPVYVYNAEEYPLAPLSNFCDKNRYKIKLQNLKSSENLSGEDLKNIFFEYISRKSSENFTCVKEALLSCDNINNDLISLGGKYDAQGLKSAIKSKDEWSYGYHRKEIIQNLNQEKLAELTLKYLPESTLRDIYKTLLKEENDYHALCRMQLTGNDINPSKGEGYNNINLQHVAMLIDKISTNLNKPSKLIQAIRIRCLNALRHSVFFCYSNDKLTFDINLLKKGEYINPYNESVAKLSNQQAYGNKLAIEMINYINKEIKNLKRIDDFANQGINIVLNSFIETYNTNQHDFNKSKNEFIGILKHAHKKLHNYEKELRDNGETFSKKVIMMLCKAFTIINYIWNCFTYYLETRATYNSFLEKVNELKDNPIVNIYGHVIANYGIRKITEIQLVQSKFSLVYQQRERPPENADAKSLDNYLEHINACLKHPVYLKLFDKITSPLMKGDYLLKFLDKLDPESNNQDKVEELKQFRKNLRNKSFKFTKDDLDNIEQIQSCLQKITIGIEVFNKHYYNEEVSSFIPAQLSQYKINTTPETEKPGTEESARSEESRKGYVKLQRARAQIACEKDLEKLETLSKRESIKLAGQAADCILSPFLGDSSKAVSTKPELSEEEKAKNSVVIEAGEASDQLNNTKPFTTNDIISPDTKCLNPVARSVRGRGI